MRGKAEWNNEAKEFYGITPAYAGKRHTAKLYPARCGDHPRVCGEKTFSFFSSLRVSGSPPRMRGKETTSSSSKTILRDHPRVCGEKALRSCKTFRAAGSPPRMRGKAVHHVHGGPEIGITPAYAGKRGQGILCGSPTGDHPRVCGEKQRGEVVPQWLRGSPPRMRGKVSCAAYGLCHSGITPAYAGKRLKRSRSTVSPAAIVPLFPSVCNKPVVSGGSPAERDAPLFLPAENAVPA